MAFTLPALPYARDALAPHISENTLNFHYAKHHQAYVDNLNKLIAGTPLESAPLEEVVKQSWAEKKMPVFNNSGQVWNHTFYWHSMKPQGGGKPTGLIADKINKDFGSFDEFKAKFAEAGTAIETVNSMLPKLNTEQKSALAAIVTAALPAIKEAAGKVLAIQGVGDLAKPVVDGLIAKLESLAKPA